MLIVLPFRLWLVHFSSTLLNYVLVLVILFFYCQRSDFRKSTAKMPFGSIVFKLLLLHRMCYFEPLVSKRG